MKISYTINLIALDLAIELALVFQLLLKNTICTITERQNSQKEAILLSLIVYTGNANCI